MLGGDGQSLRRRDPGRTTAQGDKAYSPAEYGLVFFFFFFSAIEVVWPLR
jgi:hypothetical protein